MNTIPPEPEANRPAFDTSSLKPFLPYLIPLSLFLVGLALYANAADGVLFFSWDDNRYISENPMLRDFGPNKLWQIFSEPYFAAYIPMTILSYAIEFSLWGMNPLGYHVTNIVLHALNAVLVFYFVRQLHPQQAVAVIAAALFLIHPVQVENVAWVAQRKSVLSMFFFLLASITHAKSSRSEQPYWVILAWFWFALAILAKPTAVLAGFLYAYYDHFWGQLPLPKVIWRNLPYFIIGVVGSVLIVLAHKDYGGIKDAPGGTIGRSILLMIWVVGDYASSILAPFNLNPLYLYPTDTLSLANPSIWLGIFVLGWLALTALLQPFGRPLSLFAVLWVGAMMLPVSNIIPIAIQRADRYMYYPSILLFSLVGVILVKLWEWSQAYFRWRWVLAGNVIFIAGLLSFITYHQNQIWHNEDTLWAANLIEYPRSETGLLNRGVHFYRTGEYPQATALFGELLRIYPNHYKGNRFMGLIAFQEQRFSDAAFYLRRTLQLRPGDDTTDDLGLALVELGLQAHNRSDYQQALTLYQEAGQYVPNEPILHNNIGFTYYRLGDYETAIASFQRATQLKPDYTRAWINMATAARQIDNNALSIEAYQTALGLGATFNAESNINYCVALAETQQPLETALPICQLATSAEPTNGLYLALTAHVLLLYEQPEAALPLTQAALALLPNSSLAYRCLGDAQRLLGNSEAALNAYNQALVFDPTNRRATEGLALLGG